MFILAIVGYYFSSGPQESATTFPIVVNEVKNPTFFGELDIKGNRGQFEIRADSTKQAGKTIVLNKFWSRAGISQTSIEISAGSGHFDLELKQLSAKDGVFLIGTFNGEVITVETDSVLLDYIQFLASISYPKITLSNLSIEADYAQIDFTSSEMSLTQPVINFNTKV